MSGVIRFNCLCSQKLATCDRMAGRRETVPLLSTCKNFRILSSVLEACLMMAPFSTRGSLHRGCNDLALCLHGRCPAPSSGIVRYAVVAQGMAAMAQDAAVKSPVHHCARWTNWQTMTAPISPTTPWRNCYRLHWPPRGTALRGKCLLFWMTQILSWHLAAPEWLGEGGGDQVNTQVSIVESRPSCW